MRCLHLVQLLSSLIYHPNLVHLTQLLFFLSCFCTVLLSWLVNLFFPGPFYAVLRSFSWLLWNYRINIWLFGTNRIYDPKTALTGAFMWTTGLARIGSEILRDRNWPFWPRKPHSSLLWGFAGHLLRCWNANDLCLVLPGNKGLWAHPELCHPLQAGHNSHPHSAVSKSDGSLHVSAP